MRYKIAAGFAAIAALIAGIALLDRKRPLRRLLRIPDRELYVANLGDHSILGFAIDAHGSVTNSPGRVIKGPNTRLENPIDVKLDAANRIWVANLGPWIDQPHNRPTITVYDAGAYGDTPPIRTIFPRPSLGDATLRKPSAIAFGPEPQDLLVADQFGSSGSVAEFSTTIGHDTPTGQLVGPSTQLETPTGIALDYPGRIYVAEPRQNAILIFAVRAHSFLSIPPTFVLSGPLTLLDNPAHIFVDNFGLYVVNRGTDPSLASITIYAPNATGEVQPVRRIGGTFSSNENTKLWYPYGIAVDRGGRTFVSDSNSILVFGNRANGTDFPEQILSNADTPLNSPAGLTVR